MNSIVNYSSSESEEEQPKKFMKTQKCRYPMPTAVKEIFQEKNSNTSENHCEDDPNEHEGRNRSFPHERGNWTTFGFVTCPRNDALIDLQEKIKDYCKINISINLQSIKDLHISLSRTVVLRHHWIDEFIKSIKSQMIDCTVPLIDLSKLNVYRNDEKTRTFIGICISSEHINFFQKLVHIFDFSLKEFNLPEFYKNPSFHVSLLWCLGDQYNILKNELPQLNNILNEIYEENSSDFFFNITKVQCKCGNKIFQF